MSQQQLHGTQVAGSTVDERRFGTSQSVRGEKVRVEPNRRKPVRHEAGKLLGGRAAVVITPATEQKLARFLARGFDDRRRPAASAPSTRI